MATADVETGVYAVGNDNVPEPYRPFFDNGDWVLHQFTVYGSWGFLVVAIIAHVLVWAWKPWGSP